MLKVYFKSHGALYACGRVRKNYNIGDSLKLKSMACRLIVVDKKDNEIHVVERRTTMKILVTGSGWKQGEGWTYTEDLEAIEVDTLDGIQALCEEYASSYAGSLVNCDDYEIRFYANGDVIAKSFV